MSVTAANPPRRASRGPAPSAARSRGPRSRERLLLLWLLPVAAMAAIGVSRSTGPVHTPLPEAATDVGILFGAIVAVHVLLSIARFDGDPLLLPALGLLFLIGAGYHLGLLG